MSKSCTIPKRCEACQTEFAAKSPRTRFCYELECRRERARERKRQQRGGEVVPFPVPATSADDVPSCEEVTRAALTAVGRLHTPAGVNALGLARRLDHATKDTGSSYAALSRQHLAALAEATKNVQTEPDAVDELKSRRQRRHA